MQNALRAMGYLAGAVIFGPILLAAVISTVGPSQTLRVTDAARLLQTFDDTFQPYLTTHKIDGEFYFRSCGYDEYNLMGENPISKNKGDLGLYGGYYRNRLAISIEFEKILRAERERQLSEKMNGYELRFLNRCISNSALSIACGFRVRRVLENKNLNDRDNLPDSLDRPSQRGAMKAMCTFLDGVAARKGLKLGSPPPEDR